MNNTQEISKALQLESKMKDLIRRGYALMNEMETQNQTRAYSTVMALVWSSEALAEMPTSLTIINQALTDIQTQCPNLSSVIFPQQSEPGGTDDV